MHKDGLLRVRRLLASAIACLALIAPFTEAKAQDAVNAAASGSDSATASKEEDLAKQLANPIASLISVPFQFNYDRGLNTLSTGQRANLNIQPVIPISLTPDWNVISRTILPINWSENAGIGTGQIFGTGDIVQSLFLSPTKTWNGIIWGAGPVFLLPTGSSDIYSAHQWGGGPTAVALDQSGPWTVGVLANHIWSFARTGYPAPDVSATFVQPFISYTTPDAWTFTLQSESTYDWNAGKWQIPVSAVVSKVLKIGPQLISVGGGVRYYATSPDSLAKGWGGRLILTFLFPK